MWPGRMTGSAALALAATALLVLAAPLSAKGAGAAVMMERHRQNLLLHFVGCRDAAVGGGAT